MKIIQIRLEENKREGNLKCYFNYEFGKFITSDHLHSDESRINFKLNNPYYRVKNYEIQEIIEEK